MKLQFLCLICVGFLSCRTVSGQAERCAFPVLPNGTMYTIQGCEKCPRIGRVPEKTILFNQCKPGYVLPENLYLSICLKGTWKPAPPSCIKLCPPLMNPTRNIKCRLDDDPVPCTEMMRPGTKASIQCAENYLPFSLQTSLLSIQCLDSGEWSSKVYDCRPECGFHPGTAPSESKQTVFENAPWHGVIYILKEDNFSELCAGTMISKYVMITAAHCVYEEQSKTFVDKNILRVKLGQQVDTKSLTDDSQIEAVVRRIVINDNYEGKSRYFSNDLALLDLKYVEGGSDALVIPACVDWSDQDDLFYSGQPGTIPGWSMEPKAHEKFSITHLSIVCEGECSENIPRPLVKYFTQDKFCAINDGGWKKITNKSPFWDQLVRHDFDSIVPATLLKNVTARVRVLPGTGITFVKDKLHFLRGVRSVINPTADGTFVFTSITRNLDWHYLTRASVQQLHEEKTYNINFKDCGLMGSRISKTGEEQNETPWLAMIFSQQFYLCGGAIISPHIVITESKCIRQPGDYGLFDLRTLQVAVGKRFRNLSIREPTNQILNVERIIVRRRLVELNLFYEEDIAIIELTTNIKFTDEVRPVCIDWRNNIVSHDLSNQKLYTPEVRQIARPKLEDEYLSIELEWRPDDECWKSFDDFVRSNDVTNTTFCTIMDPKQFNKTYEERWISRGEGVTVIVDGRHYLYGLRNFQNQNEGTRWYTLYTNITTHVPWLETHRLSLEYDRNFQSCGKANLKVALISHGQNATQIEHPWHVGLYYFKGQGVYEQQCGGTLVHPKIVLTAAHCVYFNYKLISPSELRVAVGKVHRDWQILDPEEKRYEVASVIIPASYYGSKGTFRDDIALLNLTQPVTVTDHVLPACIPRNKDSIPVGSNCSVVGWGLTEIFKSSEILQIAQVPTISLETCIALAPKPFKKFISRDKICTLYLNGTGPQEGDSGGGLTFEINGRHYVHGVVSVKPPDDNTFGAFTDVISHFEWIREKTSEIVVDL